MLAVHVIEVVVGGVILLYPLLKVLSNAYEPLPLVIERAYQVPPGVLRELSLNRTPGMLATEPIPSHDNVACDQSGLGTTLKLVGTGSVTPESGSSINVVHSPAIEPENICILYSYKVVPSGGIRVQFKEVVVGGVMLLYAVLAVLSKA
jgi:hypothetical protein